MLRGAGGASRLELATLGPLRQSVTMAVAVVLGLGCGTTPPSTASRPTPPPLRSVVRWEADPAPPPPPEVKVGAPELVPQWTGPVTAAALSPLGTHVAMASHGRIAVFRASDAIVVAQLSMPLAGAEAVFFSADGSRLAAVSTVGGLRVWATDDLRVVGDDVSDCATTEDCHPVDLQLRGGTLAWRRGDKTMIADLASARVHEFRPSADARLSLTPSGRHLLAARGGNGDLFDLRPDEYGTLRRERVAATGSRCRRVDVTADATWFVHHGCPQDAIVLQSVEPGGPGHRYTMRAHSLRIAPHGHRLVWISHDDHLVAWEGTGTSVLAKNVKDAAMGPGASVVVRHLDDTVALVHPDGRETSLGNPGPGLLTLDRAKAHLLMQDGDTTTVLALQSGERFPLQTPRGTERALSHPGAGPVTSLVWSRGGDARWRRGSTGRWLGPPHTQRPPLSWLGDGAVMAHCEPQVIRWESGEESSAPALQGELQVSRDRRWAVVTRPDGTIDRVELAKLDAPADRLASPPPEHLTTLVRLGPLSRRVLLTRVSPWPRPSGEKWTEPIEIFDLATGRRVSRFVPGFEPRDVSWTPDGQQVLIGAGLGAMHNLSYWVGSRIERWDVTRGRMRGQLPGARAELSPGARYIVTLVGHPTRSKTVETRLFDAQTLRPVLTLPGHPLLWRDGELYTERYAYRTTNAASERIGLDRFSVPSGKPLPVARDWPSNAELHRDSSPWTGRVYASSLPLENGQTAVIPEGVALLGSVGNHMSLLSWPRGQLRLIDRRDGATLDVVATYRPDGGCELGVFDDRSRTEGTVPMMQRRGSGLHARMEAVASSPTPGLVRAFLARAPRPPRRTRSR